MEKFILIGICVLLGMAFRRLKAFPKETPQVLNMFALHVSLPALILLQIPALNFSRQALVPALLPWVMLALSAGAVLAVARAAQWPRLVTGVLLLVVPLGNTSFMGVPMVQAFFGEAGIPYLIVYDQFGTMPIFAIYGSLILALYGRQSTPTLAGVARKALLFPPTLALGAALLLKPWPYPAPMSALLQTIAGTLTPLVMTAIGFQMRLRLRPGLLAPLGFGLGMKLVAAPLAALALCRLLGLQGLAVDVAVFEAAMPPMITAGALAVAAGMEAELAVPLIGLGIVLSFGTLPFLYALL